MSGKFYHWLENLASGFPIDVRICFTAPHADRHRASHAFTPNTLGRPTAIPLNSANMRLISAYKHNPTGFRSNAIDPEDHQLTEISSALIAYTGEHEESARSGPLGSGTKDGPRS